MTLISIIYQCNYDQLAVYTYIIVFMNKIHLFILSETLKSSLLS